MSNDPFKIYAAATKADMPKKTRKKKKKKARSDVDVIAGSFKVPSRKKRRSTGGKMATACKFKVKVGKKPKCFKKMKSATAAAKAAVRAGKKSVSVVGKRKKKVKALKVCMKGKSGKPVCKSKIRRRKRAPKEFIGPILQHYIP